MVSLNPFHFTRDLLVDEDFNSKWVEDVSYNDNNQDLLVITKEGKAYLYTQVPNSAFDELEKVAAGTINGNASMGSAVDALMKQYGPSTSVDDFWYSRVKRVNDVTTATDVTTPVTADTNVTVEMQPKIELPKATGTTVYYTIDGVAKWTNSTLPAEEALRQVVSGLEFLGLNYELEQVVVKFT